MRSQHGSSLLHRSKSAVVAGLLGASLLITPAAMAQDSTPAVNTPVATPAASPVAREASTTNLMTAQIDQLPEAPFTVRMLRIMLEPGAITPMHSHHGPEIDQVDTGEVTIRSQGDAPVTRADGTEDISTGEDVVLNVGDMVHFPAETGMYFENTGDEPAVMLSAVVIPVGPDYVNERITWIEGEPDLEGVSYQKLGDGLVQDLPQQSAEWTVDYVELPASVEVPELKGVSMISPVQGNFSFTIDVGQVQVTRADSNMLQPNAVLGTTVSLTDGDAAFFPNGASTTSRDNENQPLTLLAMDIVPTDGVTSAAAELTFSAGDGTIAEAGGSTVEVGQNVTTNTDNVNMRAEASLEADVVDQLGEGIELEVLDGPVEADDYVWYQVRVAQDGGSEGWVVAEFVDGLDVPEPAPASEGDGTSSDSSAKYEIGSKVVTTEEDVRLRPATNTNEEAIDALDLNTELTVTGEPVEAEEFIWLPVETEDGLAGYVVIDFVKSAP